jgi:septal ring factor EnvC (AmiA/AmiB activator)
MGLFLILGAGVPVCLSAASKPHSASVSVKRDLNAKKTDLKAVQRRLEREKKMHEVVAQRERNVLSRLDSSDRQLEKLELERRANEGDLSTTFQRIRLLEELESKAEVELKERRLSLGRRLKAIQRAQGTDPIFSAALGLQRSGDSSRRVRFDVLLARSNQRLLEQVEEERRRLAETTDHLNGEKVRKERIQAALTYQQRHVTNERTSRKRLLASIRTEKAVRESTIRDLDAAAHNLSSKVGELLRQQIEASAGRLKRVRCLSPPVLLCPKRRKRWWFLPRVVWPRRWWEGRA